MSFLIDSAVLAAVIVPILMLTGGLAPSWDSLPLADRVFAVVTGWAVFLGLNGYLLFTRGQTVGKSVLKTRIVGLNGALPPFSRVFLLRYLLPGLFSYLPIVGFIPGIGILLIFGRDRRCLHDYLAGTRVVMADGVGRPWGETHGAPCES